MSEFIPNPGFITEVLHEPLWEEHVDELAKEGLGIAQRLVPVDTGELRDSLHIENSDIEGGKRVVAATDHWQFPEFGTSVMEAQPYLRPIIDELGLHH